jgi:hypothetical protein
VEAAGRRELAAGRGGGVAAGVVVVSAFLRLLRKVFDVGVVVVVEIVGADVDAGDPRVSADGVGLSLFSAAALGVGVGEEES